MFTYPPKEQPDYDALRLAQSEKVRQHYQTPAVAVAIPCLQALVTAVAIAGIIGVLCLQFGWPFVWVPAGFLLTFVLVWWGRLANWNSLIWQLEKSLQVDINGDGQQGEPAEPEVVKVELHSEDNRHVEFQDIPTSREKLSDFARGVLGGTPISENTWSGSGALFSRDEYRRVRDALLSRNWLRWKDSRYPTQGVELSPAGRAVLKVFAAETHSPTLGVRKS